MEEITPELIASIATRLFRESPQSSSAPLPGFEPPTEAHIPVPTPSHAPAVAPGLPAATSPALLPGAVQNFKPGANGLSTPSLPSELPRGFHLPDTNISAPFGLSPTVAPPASNNGLSAFAQQVWSDGSLKSPGVCTQDRFLERFRRVAAPETKSSYASRPFDVEAIRRDFPILQQRIHGKPLAWLDNAATTQKPQAVIDAITNYYSRDNSNIHRAAHTLAARSTDAYEGTRQKVQNFLGASSTKEIVFARGTTEAINLAAQTFGKKFLHPGDEIILSTLEHHANIVPWQMAAREKGAIIRVIPVNDRGEVMLGEYENLLGPRTKLVAITHASNSLGTVLPIAEMTRMAKRYGARVLIDGAQTVAHIAVNVQEIDCDFFVFSGHKVFAPTGIGVLYGKEELLDLLPPWQGGGNMIKNVTFEETTYHGTPARFEAGTPSIGDAVGLGAALDYVTRLGLPNIAKYEHELLEYGTEKLSRIDGLRLVGTAREKVGVLSFVLQGKRTEEVGRLLDLEGIAVRAGHHCSQPSLRRFGLESTVRPSLSIYNTREELDRLAEAIRRIQRL
ncbi:cysteine desulfurase [Zavarzinella formosa]|uniref:cysteine desulfurase n=1 Tax=Zavarzinella formosa TaxID=360055 RepID=UPI00031F829B|nr:cysteine desulfurase [Zavarzinella formosa]